MATLAEIRRQFELDNAGLLALARAHEQRLTDAIGLGTQYTPRLEQFRRYVRRAIGTYNAAELTRFLGGYEEAFRSEIRFAEAAHERLRADDRRAA